MKYCIVFILMTWNLSLVNSQVVIEPNKVGINNENPISTFAINGSGHSLWTSYFKSTNTTSGSMALHGEAANVQGGWTFGIVGRANLDGEAVKAVGTAGYSNRSAPFNSGRSTGVFGNAGNATPGANYAIFGQLVGSNSGTAILGHDSVSNPNWSEVLPNGTSYAGYFYGQGYFKDNLGIGIDTPLHKLHVKGGDVYFEDLGTGVVIKSPNGAEWRITVTDAGVLTADLIPSP